MLGFLNYSELENYKWPIGVWRNCSLSLTNQGRASQNHNEISLYICQDACCSVAQSGPTLYNPLDCSTSGFRVLHHYFFFLIKKWNKKTTPTPHQNSELEVTFGDALSPLVHFQEGKLTRGANYLLKVTHQCSEQNSGPLIPTSEPVSERVPQVSGYGGGGCGHETGICRLWVPGTMGSAGTLGKEQGGSLCGPGLTSSAAANSVGRGCVQGSFGPQLCIQGFSRACIRLKYWFSISRLKSPQLYWEGTDK